MHGLADPEIKMDSRFRGNDEQMAKDAGFPLAPE
jgi:hypothetical protein